MALYPDRLVAFRSFNPTRDYALDELEFDGIVFIDRTTASRLRP